MKAGRILRAAAVAGVLVFFLFPFYWAWITSLKSGPSLFEVEWIPSRVSFENYRRIFEIQPFGRNLLNSVAVAGMTVVISTALGLFSSYALARNRFRGRRVFLGAVLVVSMIPQIAILSGLFELIRSLGLFNRWSGLVLSYLIFTLPFTVWNLHVHMRGVPREIEEAAILDGAGVYARVTRIFAPILMPALVTTGLLSFIAAWNEFLFALTFTLSERARTVPVAIAQISGSSSHEVPWGLILAASLVVTLPVVGIVLVFQRRIVSGLTAGAVKG